MDGLNQACLRMTDRSHSAVDSSKLSMQGRMIEQRGSSSTAQLRKIKKPLIEKRRRERINECLGQLKSLVLEAMNKDESRYSRMEKADILEMTVEHLKSARQRRSHRSHDDVTQLPPAYALGFNECIQHVNGYLSEQRDVTGNAVMTSAVAPLVSHLGNILNNQVRSTAEGESMTERRFRANSASPGSDRLADSDSPNSVANCSTTEWIEHQQPRYSLSRLGKNDGHHYEFVLASPFESVRRVRPDYRSSCGDSPSSNKSSLISYGASDELGSICSYQNDKDKPCSSDQSDSNSRSSPLSTSSNRSTSCSSTNPLSFYTQSTLPSPLFSDESNPPSPLLSTSRNDTTYSATNNSSDYLLSARGSSMIISPSCQPVSWRPW